MCAYFEVNNMSLLPTVLGELNIEATEESGVRSEVGSNNGIDSSQVRLVPKVQVAPSAQSQPVDKVITPMNIAKNSPDVSIDSGDGDVNSASTWREILNDVADDLTSLT